MSAIEAVALQGSPSVELQQSISSPARTDFEPFLSFIKETNAAVASSDNMLQRSAMGESIAPHELMLSIESAKLQLQMLVEVRNRCVEAYQEVMRMQV